jgi:hypothetical protein
MAIPDYPSLSISHSQTNLFISCKRRWWWRYVGHWKGWLDTAPEKVQLAYRIGKLEPLSAWAGKRVHDGISSYLLVPGKSIDAIRISVIAEMRKEFTASARVPVGQFGDSKAFRLEEHYFGRPVSNQRLEEIIEEVDSNLLAFDAFCDNHPVLSFRRLVAEAKDSDRFCRVDSPYVNFDQRGVNSALIGNGMVTFYAAPDFAVHLEDSKSLMIVDWKTGREPQDSPEEPTSQLLGYGLFADLKYPQVVAKVDHLDLYEFYLPECNFIGGKVDKFSIDETRSRVKQQADEILSLRGNESAIPSSRCPPTPDVRRCGYCPFIELCEEGQDATSLGNS